MLKRFLLTYLPLLLLCTASNVAAKTAKIAIIIDDIGNSQYHRNFTKLPTSVSFSILPFTPYSKELAKYANQQNREVLLHIPMQAHQHNHLLGKGALTLAMNKGQHQQMLNKAIAAVPYAIGVNNHMGSKLTEQIPSMQWTMQLLAQQGYFFVDSRTSVNSVAESSAMIAGLPSLRRHVFLDNIRTPEAMEKQFQQALKHSKKEPYTIIIAHPYPETFEFLAKRLTELGKAHQLVSISALIPEQQRLALQRKKAQFQQARLLQLDAKPTQL